MIPGIGIYWFFSPTFSLSFTLEDREKRVQIALDCRTIDLPLFDNFRLLTRLFHSNPNHSNHCNYLSPLLPEVPLSSETTEAFTDDLLALTAVAPVKSAIRGKGLPMPAGLSWPAAYGINSVCRNYSSSSSIRFDSHRHR